MLVKKSIYRCGGEEEWGWVLWGLGVMGAGCYGLLDVGCYGCWVLWVLGVMGVGCLMFPGLSRPLVQLSSLTLITEQLPTSMELSIRVGGM